MKDFLDFSSWSAKELFELIELAVHLKREWKSGGNRPILAGKVLAMIFQKPSLRTRVSFDVAMNHLGGHAIMLSPDEIGLGKRESVCDVARVLSGMVQGIMARVFEHTHVVELAQWASVPVINGLSDDEHPCQALADMLTIYEHFGQLKGLKFTYIGDGNNVAASSLLACAQFGMDFAIASPKGYEIPARFMVKAAQLATATGIKIETFTDPQAAVYQADVVYTDTWVSMGQEKEAEERLPVFMPYQVNADLMRHAKPSAVVLHCLPAHRGQEITDDVMDGAQSLVFEQAANRLHAQKALLVRLLA
ncbi:MAG: ornithine carbamoyltransferase [Anaerolineae bacterium]|jgi:ornithine carbamoyltransferase|nr:ornithine carbamoyltransferase [Anaerolineae bacterium]